jgi:hypothetical protein
MRFITGTANFLTGFVAVVLSVALVLALMFIPLLVTVHGALEPEMIQDLLISVLLDPNQDPSEDTQAAMIQKVMESQAVRDLLGLYIEDMFAALEGRSVLTDDALQEILEKNMDELFPVFRELIAADAESIGDVSDMELEFVVTALLYGGVELLMEQLPTAAQLGITAVKIVPPVLPQKWNAQSLAEFGRDCGAYWDAIWVLDAEFLNRQDQLEFHGSDLPVMATQALVLLQNARGLHLLCLLVLVLSLLVLVLRLGQGFRCLNWLAVAYFIAGIMDTLIAVAAKLLVQQAAMTGSPLPIMDTVMELLNRFLIAGVAILAVCIVLAIVVAIGNKLIKRK